MGVIRERQIRAILYCLDNCNIIAHTPRSALTDRFTSHSLWIGSWVVSSFAANDLCEVTDEQSLSRSTESRFTAFITTLISTLKICSKTKDLQGGRKVHEYILKNGLLVPCLDALVILYVKCGALATARDLLCVHKSKSVSCWTALITGYTQHGHGREALYSFELMQHEGVSPDSLTFTSILKACGTVKAEVKGKQIHDKIVQQGLLDGDVKIGTAIVDMYAKCGNLIKAQHVLEELPSRNIVTWSALIAGYAEQGQGEKALSCFEMMKHEGIVPNAVTFVSALKACGSINAAEKGKQIHDEITRQGLLRNNHVLATALIDMYAKCGALKRAKRVLDELPSRNVINWSALIAAYAQQGQDEQALSSFERLQDEGLSPTSVTFASTLKSCGSLKAAEKGEKIHYEIERRGLLHNDHILGTAVIDMYAKCGVLSKAWTVLEELPYQCVSMWAALIGGFVQHDKGEQALHCFKLMQQKGISPNVATFSCILNACSHLGLVEDCFRHYSSMRCKHGIDPDFEHTTCMVDLFGRAGHIDRAVKLTMEMSFSDYPILWYALMSACHKWSNMNIGRWAFRHSVQLDAQDAGVCNLMANMYKANGVESYVDIDSCTDQ